MHYGKNFYRNHFKMDTLQSCINLMTMNCFMASLDLTDAYYYVSINPDLKKYLKFKVGTQYANLLHCLMGWALHLVPLSHIMKLVYSTFANSRSSVSSGCLHVDDSSLLGYSFVQCQTNNSDTLFGDVGFNVPKEQSVTQPTQILEHIGFVLNSINMTVSLPRGNN